MPAGQQDQPLGGVLPAVIHSPFPAQSWRRPPLISPSSGFRFAVRDQQQQQLAKLGHKRAIEKRKPARSRAGSSTTTAGGDRFPHSPHSALLNAISATRACRGRQPYFLMTVDSSAGLEQGARACKLRTRWGREGTTALANEARNAFSLFTRPSRGWREKSGGPAQLQVRKDRDRWRARRGQRAFTCGRCPRRRAAAAAACKKKRKSLNRRQ